MDVPSQSNLSRCFNLKKRSSTYISNLDSHNHFSLFSPYFTRVFIIFLVRPTATQSFSNEKEIRGISSRVFVGGIVKSELTR